MDLSTDYLRIPFSRMEKCFTSVSDPLCFILRLSAFIKKVDKMNLVQEKNQPVEDEDEDW